MDAHLLAPKTNRNTALRVTSTTNRDARRGAQHSKNMHSIDDHKSSLKQIAARFMPKLLTDERNIFFRLKKAGPTYVKLRMMDAIGSRDFNLRLVPAGARSFLFVCHGNIMRSPMAELMLKHALSAIPLEGAAVRSAGMHATPGTEAHPQARVAASHLGLSLDDHRSKLITEEMVADADAVFAMDLQNLAELLTHYPQARDKIFMLSAYAEGAEKGRPIADPYFGDQNETVRCYALLQTCVNNLSAGVKTSIQGGSLSR
jgi:protein-tyrosine-phosphatase